jgi:EAL domain-containing protein (putative c-di-GMP-specific phosphodiesterase class I)
MVSIGRDLGLTVVVEGVETAEQRNILLRHGCRIGQGYFYSMPVSGEDFAWMLSQQMMLPMHSPADDKTPAAA